MKNLSLIFITILLLHLCAFCSQKKTDQVRTEVNFNSSWKFYLGDEDKAKEVNFDDTEWRQLDLPHDWSVEGSFSDKWASGTGYLPA